jgi:hypothetical protein
MNDHKIIVRNFVNTTPAFAVGAPLGLASSEAFVSNATLQQE